MASTGDPACLPQTFRFLSRYYDGRLAQAKMLVNRTVRYGITLAVAAIVLLIALSVFQPMVDLINHLAH